MDDFARERLRQRCNRRNYRRIQGGFVGGIILAGIGVLLLLQNLGIPFFDDLERFWPIILVVVGAIHAGRALSFSGRLWGGAIAITGVIFILRNLDIIHGNVWRFLWPGILIVIGGMMLARVFDQEQGWTPGDHGPRPGGPPEGSPSEPPPNAPWMHFGAGSTGSTSFNTLSEWAIFSGVHRRIDAGNFQGGDIFAMFGGVELDMRRASTAREEIHIEANAMFGGIELWVPDNWNVTVRGAGVFGGYEDKTLEARVTSDAKRPHLVVNGFAIFGGVTVKN